MSDIERIIRIMSGNLVQIELREGTTCEDVGQSESTTQLLKLTQWLCMVRLKYTMVDLV